MKNKFVFSIVLFMLVAMSARAQIQVGLTGGLNITHMTYEHSNVKNAMSNRAGFFAGPTAVVGLPYNDLLSFDVSALYSICAAKYGGSNHSLKSQNISVPLNLRVQFYDYANIATMFVFAGPQVDFALSKKQQYLAGGHNSAGDLMSDRYKAKSTQWGLNIGVGAVALKHVQARIGYHIALGNSGEFLRLNHSKNTTNHRSFAKIHACQVSVAYLF
jgi:hypothetical protein